VADPILQIKGLGREVCIENGRLKVVDDVSFAFEPGGIYTILGPSGAGKSSLLRLLNRLDEPSSGEVLFEGRDYRQIPPPELRRKVGYLLQVPHMFAGTVADNVRFAQAELDDAALDEVLRLVSFKTEKRSQPVDNLSVGEQQRVALARLLATGPTVVLLDEPTAALDPTYTELIEKAIRRIVDERGVTAIMVSHNPDQARRMHGEGLLLVGGRLVESGPIGALLDHPSSDLGRRYVSRELS